MRRQASFVAIAALAVLSLFALAGHERRADIAILTHRADDLAPARVHAAADFGIFAVSLLVTWSRRLTP